ncbi:uncharacterized protein ASPGLDRAFT_701221 [Aspergillus glaucus CBS 516.65]|uniref:Uncharacterized protein n=1 Tax=Aspergillus glaucus CBS 516.65 TaxID=1160497 RepID=A0A1L9VWW4_ASPGL|nr:hypothetical protein ASPGLDRAFT_701221 [Aspergillus glaucus CBS 516.65]OJJ88377.1 hypothetical protein ASPGLDRAFT_701221 [Aspergillus glaucus CBS 516.65]
MLMAGASIDIQRSRAACTSYGIPIANNRTSQTNTSETCIEFRMVGKITFLYSHLPTPLDLQTCQIQGCPGLPPVPLPLSSLYLPFIVPLFSFFFFLFFLLSCSRSCCSFQTNTLDLLVDSHENPSSPPRGGLPVFR